MRFLITGGAGFLGSHLCEALIGMNNEVIALDNLFTGSLRNIECLRKNSNFTFIEHDVIEPIEVDVDGIFNLACPASPIHYQSSPTYTWKTSVIGSLNMLELARRHDCRILQASTSEVYGDLLISPQKEDYWGNVNPIGIRSCYDEGKRAAETLFSDYAREYGTDSRIVRIFNTYSPRMQQHDGRVVSNFINQALRNEDITIYGSGDQIRSFCYVDDLIEGILKVFFSEANFTPINLGNPDPVTISRIAEEIIELTSSMSKVIYLPLPSDDPEIREPEIGHALNALQWKPKISREQGLKKTIDFFEKQLHESR